MAVVPEKERERAPRVRGARKKKEARRWLLAEGRRLWE